ncbi:T9SS-dependent choice-of-anchor J family protein [Brumimicrobium aurantiacum]|uniref:T9SS C-terminal target domain-containing protein n=1 Tax=Brumimicrobium aurantiacum TaxID=1737063 RepID=A0A3E1EW59_9FLAO|nr:choice-of-anchor J domain-containing protein [Brumimicrobium aurantiacum]RFC53790.1 T9SS C-terminal target domain-containing protein [Brumimicrobium aurantiacum]
MKYILTSFALVFGLSVIGQVTILEENFDAPTLPSTFTLIDNDGNTVANDVQEYTEAWIPKEDPMDSSNGTASSTSYFSPVDRADRWLITSQMTLGASGNFVSWNTMSHDPSFPDSYKVMVSTTGNSLSDFTDTLTVVSNETPYWSSHTESLEEYANETIYLAFVNTTYNGFKLYMDSLYVREQDPLSVADEKIEVAIYPNPTTDVLNLSAGNAKIESIQIFNSFGQKVLDKNTSSSQLSIDVNHLDKGIYFTLVKTDQGVSRSKIIVEN